MLALEIKGTDSSQNKAKRDALSEWVKLINGTGGFGQRAWDVAFKTNVQDVIYQARNGHSTTPGWSINWSAPTQLKMPPSSFQSNAMFARKKGL